MPEPSEPQPVPPPVEETPARHGVQAGRDVEAGRDIAGRDIVTSTTVVGFSQQAVIKIIIITAVIVFITAFCFFSGGITLGAGVILALERPVASSQGAAESMQLKLQAIEALPPGQAFAVQINESELSSFFRFNIAPQMGITDGRVRLLSDRELVVGGMAESLGDRRFAARFEVQSDPEQTLRLTGAAVEVLDLGAGSFGWVAVPLPVLQDISDQVNQFLGSSFRITDVSKIPDTQPGLPGTQPAWVLDGVTVQP